MRILYKFESPNDFVIYFEIHRKIVFRRFQIRIDHICRSVAPLPCFNLLALCWSISVAEIVLQ